MKANQGAIVLIDQPADHGRLRSVLHDWGYTGTEIQRFLNQNEMSPLIQVSMNEQVYANAELLLRNKRENFTGVPSRRAR